MTILDNSHSRPGKTFSGRACKQASHISSGAAEGDLCIAAELTFVSLSAFLVFDPIYTVGTCVHCLDVNRIPIIFPLCESTLAYFEVWLLICASAFAGGTGLAVRYDRSVSPAIWTDG